MGKGAVGFEVDFGYSPNFFETSTPPSGFFKFTPDSNVTTLTGNLVIGAHGGRIRPYVVGGVGLIRTKVQDISQVISAKIRCDNWVLFPACSRAITCLPSARAREMRSAFASA